MQSVVCGNSSHYWNNATSEILPGNVSYFKIAPPFREDGKFQNVQCQMLNISLPSNRRATNPGALFSTDLTIVSYVTLFFYLGTCAIGLMGNGLVLYIISYYKTVRKKSVANYYIWNLSMADLLFVVTLPVFGYVSYTHHWPFGSFSCKLAHVVRDSNKYASVYTLVALSVDRYLASFISHRVARFRTVKHCGAVCVLIWLASLTITVPYWLYSRTQLTFGNKTSCRVLWPNDGNKITYLSFWTYFQLTVALVIPVIIILASYLLLMLRIRNMIKPGQRSGIKRPSQKMTKTILVVVLTFVLCQTPYHVVEINSLHQQMQVEAHRLTGTMYVPTHGEMRSFIYLNGLAQILVFISSCCNPIIYGLMNENFRHLYQIVLCRCQKERPDDDIMGNDSGAHLSTQASATNYRFEITFHKPFRSAGSKRNGRRKNPPETETVPLDDFTTDTGEVSRCRKGSQPNGPDRSIIKLHANNAK